MDFLNRFGEKVKLTRKSNGLTQQALAKKTGFDYRYIGFIEKGQINPTIKTLLRLARALDVDPCELMPADIQDRGRTDIYRLGEREMMMFSTMRHLFRTDLEHLKTWDRMIEKALGRRPR